MRRRLLTIACLLGLVLYNAAPAVSQDGFKIIVHASNEVPSLAKTDIAGFFMKKKKTWDSNGESVFPVDQSPNSDVRKAFSKEIHGRSASAIKSHWQRMIFSGRSVPPPERASDTQVLEFVAANPGAIGYVAADAVLGSGVKQLAIQ